MTKPTRRAFIKNTALTTGVASLLPSALGLTSISNKAKEELSIHLFSKHLQFLDLKSAAEKVAEIGFDGLDLTVRPGGHVLPENIHDALPKAIEDIKKGGSQCSFMTTAIEDAHNKIDKNVLTTAADLGILYYRSNWFKYKDGISMEDTLINCRHRLQELSLLNKKLGLIGCYQNHAGTGVGASFWELKSIIEDVDKDHFGIQYDIRHAVADGGKSWENGVRLLHKNIKTIALKDFRWEKNKSKWDLVNVPIGEGMVDFDKYFKLLKKYKINVPVSLHLEYDLGGAEKGKRDITTKPSEIYKAMKNDLDTVRALWADA